MNRDCKISDFYSVHNNDLIAVILITPNQMICKSSDSTYHKEIVKDIYEEIYDDSFFIDNDDYDSWIDGVTKQDNNILFKLTKTDMLVYLPEYINTNQYRSLKVLNKEITDMIRLPFKISYVDERFFDKNQNNLDDIIDYFYTHIDDNIIGDDTILTEKTL